MRTCVAGRREKRLTPKVPRVPLAAPSLSFVRVGATMGVPEGLPTPWGMGGVETGVWFWIGVVIASDGRWQRLRKVGAQMDEWVERLGGCGWGLRG